MGSGREGVGVAEGGAGWEVGLLAWWGMVVGGVEGREGAGRAGWLNGRVQGQDGRTGMGCFHEHFYI